MGRAAYESSSISQKTGLLLIDRGAIAPLARISEYLTLASSPANPINADAAAHDVADGGADATSRPGSVHEAALAGRPAAVYAPQARVVQDVRAGFVLRLLPVLLNLATELTAGNVRRRAKFPALNVATAVAKREPLQRTATESSTAASTPTATETPTTAGDDVPPMSASDAVRARLAFVASAADRASAVASSSSTDLLAMGAGGGGNSAAGLGASGGISVGSASKALMAVAKLRRAAQQASQLTLDIARPETGNHPFVYYLRDLLLLLRVRPKACGRS